jgi:hypothetical protein
VNDGNKVNRDVSNQRLIAKINTPCHKVLMANTGNLRKGEVEYHTPYNNKTTIETSMKNSIIDPPHKNQLKCSVEGLFKYIFFYAIDQLKINT